jgi:hypothetical protein
MPNPRPSRIRSVAAWQGIAGSGRVRVRFVRGQDHLRVPQVRHRSSGCASTVQTSGSRAIAAGDGLRPSLAVSARQSARSPDQGLCVWLLRSQPQQAPYQANSEDPTFLTYTGPDCRDFCCLPACRDPPGCPSQAGRTTAMSAVRGQGSLAGRPRAPHLLRGEPPSTLALNWRNARMS